MSSSSGKIEISLSANEELITHSDWIQTESEHLLKKDKLFFSWRYPFLSYATGLAWMISLKLKDSSITETITLAHKKEHNLQIIPVDLNRYQAVVVHPKYVVATRGNIKITSRWILSNLHGWITGRLRYIIFYGEGTLYLYGKGVVSLTELKDNNRIVEYPHLLAHQATLAFVTVRHEPFLQFYRNKIELFKYKFEGNGIIVTQQIVSASNEKNINPFKRFVDSIFNIIGKVFGF